MGFEHLHDHWTVRLGHTDAAGVMFFPAAFEVEQEFFERWLEAGGMSVRGMLEGAHAPTPVVHCEADYRRPVRVGDRLAVRLAGVGVGRKSFELAWEMSLDGAVAVAVRVRRSSIDRASGHAVDLPPALRSWLESCQARTAAIT
jgi:1,4-dihydroxy-2-naphthoyl-CoA hydrolase